MFIGGVQEYAREVVSKQAIAPREASLRKLAASSYSHGTMRLIVGVGLVLAVPVLIIALVAPEAWSPLRVGLLAFAAAVTVLVIGTPGIYAWRMWRALKSGTVTRARILRVAFAGPTLRPDTIDAQKHGMARGTWRVMREPEPFDASFECDAVWASQLSRGMEWM